MRLLHVVLPVTFAVAAACRSERSAEVAPCDITRLVAQWQLYKARKQQLSDAVARLKPGDSFDAPHAICREHEPFFRGLQDALEAHGEHCGYSSNLDGVPDPTLPDRTLTFVRARKGVEKVLSECEQIARLARDGKTIKEIE